jgi:Domain of unknown function (DUF4248)
MEENFKIRSFGYGKLAQMYFPNIAKNIATVQFRRWIRVNISLQNQLNISGFKIGQKTIDSQASRINYQFVWRTIG